MKKILLILLALLVIGAAVVGWIFFGASTGFSEKEKYLYIPSNATKEMVVDSIRSNNIIRNEWAFNMLTDRMNYWSKIRPGRYKIREGESVLNIVRKLRNGQQDPVNFVVVKFRTKEDVARAVGRRLEPDSSDMYSFITNRDTLAKYNVTEATAMTMILPDSYTFLWNTSTSKFFSKMVAESKKFWNEERRSKAAAIGLSPTEVYILASIIEEETNADDEKDTIASVYLNRLKIGMPLQADPTVKFALNDFAITRVTHQHLQVQSPYNTYRNKGLPPGPICTPSKKTIDAALNPATTKYIYFVANPNFTRTHVFSETYQQHLQKAKLYHQELNRRDSIRKAKEANNG